MSVFTLNNSIKFMWLLTWKLYRTVSSTNLFKFKNKLSCALIVWTVVPLYINVVCLCTHCGLWNTIRRFLATENKYMYDFLSLCVGRAFEVSPVVIFEDAVRRFFSDGKGWIWIQKRYTLWKGWNHIMLSSGWIKKQRYF